MSETSSSSSKADIKVDISADISTNFSETARIMFAAGGVQDTLDRVVQIAVDIIEGCDFAGIFVAHDGAITTTACTEPIVAEVDALQSQTDEGPCLDAISQRVTVYAEDLADDNRWPIFGSRATTNGIRCVLALPLFTNGTLGALNLYARYPHAFGVIDRARGLLLAALAALALQSAQTHEDQDRRDINFHAALGSREIIGQAQGILMERERITGDEAFDILRRASQHLNLKLLEVAQTLVDTGERPDAGPSPSP